MSNTLRAVLGWDFCKTLRLSSFLHVSQVSLSRTWRTDSAITLAMTVFSQTLLCSPQGRSVFPRVGFFAQLTMYFKGRAAVGILLLS